MTGEIFSIMGSSMSYWIRDYHVEYGCQIDTKTGTIGGKTFCFKDGRKVNAFMGIPYAKNGSHGDRFKVCLSRLFVSVTEHTKDFWLQEAFRL